MFHYSNSSNILYNNLINWHSYSSDFNVIYYKDKHFDTTAVPIIISPFILLVMNKLLTHLANIIYYLFN